MTTPSAPIGITSSFRSSPEHRKASSSRFPTRSYLRRPEVPISTEAMTTPQTHEAAEASAPATLSGVVTDVTGAVIPRATVTATSVATGANVAAQTTDNGRFTFLSIPPGLYDLTIKANGFQTYVRRRIQVSSIGSQTINASLNVGSVAETVTVTATADTLSTETASLSQQLSARSRPFLYSGATRVTDTNVESNVSTSNFDDFFEYRLAQPVTIHKNESAMVPILQQTLPVERVTLWSEIRNPSSSRPLA